MFDIMKYNIEDNLYVLLDGIENVLGSKTYIVFGFIMDRYKDKIVGFNITAYPVERYNSHIDNANKNIYFIKVNNVDRVTKNHNAFEIMGYIIKNVSNSNGRYRATLEFDAKINFSSEFINTLMDLLEIDIESIGKKEILLNSFCDSPNKINIPVNVVIKNTKYESSHEGFLNTDDTFKQQNCNLYLKIKNGTPIIFLRFTGSEISLYNESGSNFQSNTGLDFGGDVYPYINLPYDHYIQNIMPDRGLRGMNTISRLDINNILSSIRFENLETNYSITRDSSLTLVTNSGNFLRNYFFKSRVSLNIVDNTELSTTMKSKSFLRKYLNLNAVLSLNRDYVVTSREKINYKFNLIPSVKKRIFLFTDGVGTTIDTLKLYNVSETNTSIEIPLTVMYRKFINNHAWKIDDNTIIFKTYSSDIIRIFRLGDRSDKGSEVVNLLNKLSNDRDDNKTFLGDIRLKKKGQLPSYYEMLFSNLESALEDSTRPRREPMPKYMWISGENNSSTTSSERERDISRLKPSRPIRHRGRGSYLWKNMSEFNGIDNFIEKCNNEKGIDAFFSEVLFWPYGDDEYKNLDINETVRRIELLTPEQAIEKNLVLTYRDIVSLYNSLSESERESYFFYIPSGRNL